MRRSRAAHITMQFIYQEGRRQYTRCERVADIVRVNGDRNFWSKVKKIQSSKPATVRTIDGVSDDNSIAQLLASNYRDLYSSVPYKSPRCL